MKYIDIHSHLDFSDFDADREMIIEDMNALDVGTFSVGTTIDSSKNAIALAQSHDDIYAIVGIHPVSVHETKIEELNVLPELIIHPKCVAIGECGMDFFHEPLTDEIKEKQLTFFIKQIEYAIQFKKPLMIHCRKAYPATLDVLKSYKKLHPELHAHFHFFTESLDTAQIILDLGWTVSFTGVITFVKEYEELVKFVPLESMMIETDSPYVSPKSKRGKRNDPRNVIEIAQKIAEIKEIALKEVVQTIRENTKRVFGV